MGDALKVQKLDDFRWRIPREGAMHTDGLVFASEPLMERMKHDRALEQVRNVACLPGIVGPEPRDAGPPLGVRLRDRRGGRASIPTMA